METAPCVNALVTAVEFSPGHADGSLTLTAGCADGTPRRYLVHPNDPNAEVTAGGELVRAGELLAWLVLHRTRVTIYSKLKADFVRAD